MSAAPASAITARTALWLVFASPSRLLLLFLLIANREYLAVFLEAGARPVGLLSLGAVVLLSTASYLAILGCVQLRRWGRSGLSIALAVVAFVTLEIPACLLLLLTPAALLLMECFAGGECASALPLHPLVSMLR